jgi:hypothetical protein
LNMRMKSIVRSTCPIFLSRYLLVPIGSDALPPLER